MNTQLREQKRLELRERIATVAERARSAVESLERDGYEPDPLWMVQAEAVTTVSSKEIFTAINRGELACLSPLGEPVQVGYVNLLTWAVQHLERAYFVLFPEDKP